MSGAAQKWDNNAWNIVPHVCKHCLGRVIEKGTIFRCSSCGATSPGNPKGICGCGIKVQGGKGERYHCRANPSISFENPSEYTICLGDTPAVPVKG